MAAELKQDIFGRGIREVLHFELDFLEDGGYGRSVRTPRLAKLVFVESPTCLNFNDPQRPYPCQGCALMNFVPEERRGESVPCHHIPLTPAGETIATLFDPGNEMEAHDALRDWLRREITRLDAKEAAKEAEEESNARRWAAET